MPAYEGQNFLWARHHALVKSVNNQPLFVNNHLDIFWNLMAASVFSSSWLGMRASKRSLV